MFKGTLYGLHTSQVDGFHSFLRHNLVIVIAAICLVVQLILLAVSFKYVKSYTTKTSWFHVIIMFLITTFYYVAMNGNQLLLLYARPNSRFHSVYYEILRIVNLFLVTIDLDMTSYGSSIGAYITQHSGYLSLNKDEKKKETNIVFKRCLRDTYSKTYRCWYYFTILVRAFILIPIVCVTSMVFAAQELAAGQLPSFDRGLFICMIVASSLGLLKCLPNSADILRFVIEHDSVSPLEHKAQLFQQETDAQNAVVRRRYLQELNIRDRLDDRSIMKKKAATSFELSQWASSSSFNYTRY